jgi:hypothetical protein
MRLRARTIKFGPFPIDFFAANSPTFKPDPGHLHASLSQHQVRGHSAQASSLSHLKSLTGVHEHLSWQQNGQLPCARTMHGPLLSFFTLVLLALAASDLLGGMFGLQISCFCEASWCNIFPLLRSRAQR